MTEYSAAFIRAHPVLARCQRCRRIEPIHAPTLDNVACFWCGPSRTSRMEPLDAEAYRLRLDTLHLHDVSAQWELPL